MYVCMYVCKLHEWFKTHKTEEETAHVLFCLYHPLNFHFALRHYKAVLEDKSRKARK